MTQPVFILKANETHVANLGSAVNGPWTADGHPRQSTVGSIRIFDGSSPMTELRELFKANQVDYDSYSKESDEADHGFWDCYRHTQQGDKSFRWNVHGQPHPDYTDL